MYTIISLCGRPDGFVFEENTDLRMQVDSEAEAKDKAEAWIERINATPKAAVCTVQVFYSKTARGIGTMVLELHSAARKAYLDAP